MTNLQADTQAVKLTGGEQQRLINLCNIFNLNVTDASDNPVGALFCLTHLYAMPVVKDRSERHKYGNRILQASYTYFPPQSNQFTSRFHGGIAKHVVMIQEFPSYYADLNKSSEALANKYEALFSLAVILRLLGIGAIGSGIVAGITEGVKTGSVRAGVEMAAKRMAGQSALMDAIKGRLPASAARFAGVFGVLLVASGVIAYVNAIEEMENIREIILHRHQSGDVSPDIYRRVFSEIDPALIKKYWEM